MDGNGTGGLFFFVMKALVALALLATLGTSFAQQPAERLRPPATIDCPRDHLTSYTGAVHRYRRTANRTELRIRTDWDTTEDVVIAHHSAAGPDRWFLMEGKPFQAGDWARLEEAQGRLRTGMRATAWVCDDGRNPVVDWNPPREH